MQKTRLTIPWEQGLHARPATRLVLLARRFRSSIHIRAQDRIADAGSIISILLLYATFGAVVEVEAHGEDKEMSLSAIRQLFLEESLPETELRIDESEERNS